jgi:ribose-phosphate pyrophosphokinase
MELSSRGTPESSGLGPSGLGPSGLGPSGLGPSGLGHSGLEAPKGASKGAAPLEAQERPAVERAPLEKATPEKPKRKPRVDNKRVADAPDVLEMLRKRPVPSVDNGFKIFAGNAHPQLARDIARCLDVPLGKMVTTRFANGESWCAVDESIRGADVFLVQPTCAPVNDTVMELLIMCDAFRRASARRIVPIIPYFGYARQDKKVRAREPITAKLIANMIESAGADRIFAIDLHAGQIQGFFNTPVDHLPAQPIIADYLIKNGICDKEVTVVSPDVGGVTRATALAERLGADLAIVAKRRPEPGKVKIIDVIGDVKGQICVLIDDMIDSGGTFCAAAAELADMGAREIYGCATHPVLSGDAVRRIQDSAIKELIVTDTIPIPPERMISKLTVLSIAQVCAQAILRIHHDDSVSTMFESLG